MYTYSFEKLNVWQNARQLTKDIYETTNNYPTEERFGLVNQMRRAAISIASNIAEGSSRATSRDQSHFYNTAYSSLMELLNQIIISNDLNYLDTAKLSALREQTEKVSNQLNALKNSISQSRQLNA